MTDRFLSQMRQSRRYHYRYSSDTVSNVPNLRSGSTVGRKVMPIKEGTPDGQFVDAVKPALESLLSDLQRTTEVLRRAQQRNSQERELTESRSAKYNRNSYDNDIEPIYQEQNVAKNTRASSEQYRKSTTSPDGIGAKSSTLDSMLGNLQIDMTKHGIHTIPKGDCASCDKPIIGQVIIALGKMWHPEHYVCSHCGEQIGHRSFFERGGKAYCENDYHDLFSPRCAYCNGPIKNRCISALNKNFHPEHFTCADCGQPFGTDGFHERDGVAYCREDFFRLFAPKCHGCNEVIKSKFITALGTHWHPNCFICQKCNRSFDGTAFFEHEGKPLCEQHFHEVRGSLCVECRRPINGRCVSAMGAKFHPEHFCCSYCNRQLTRGTFREANRKPFCHRCFDKINCPM